MERPTRLFLRGAGDHFWKLGANGIDRTLMERPHTGSPHRIGLADGVADGTRELRLSALHFDNDPGVAMRREDILEEGNPNALAAMRILAVTRETKPGIHAFELGG